MSYKSVHIVIGSPFPRMIRMCKVNIYTECSGNVLMSGTLFSIVCCSCVTMCGLVSVSLSLLLSMTLSPFFQARITDTYRLLCHLWQAMLSYASCRLLYRIQRCSFFSLEQEREFLSLALSFCFGFFHLYELDLGNNNEAASNNACGFAAFAVFLLTAYSTINFFVVLPSMTV